MGDIPNGGQNPWTSHNDALFEADRKYSELASKTERLRKAYLQLASAHQQLTGVTVAPFFYGLEPGDLDPPQ